MAHSRDKRTGMNRQQNLCLIPVRLYPFFRNGFILRWGKRFVRWREEKQCNAILGNWH